MNRKLSKIIGGLIIIIALIAFGAFLIPRLGSKSNPRIIASNFIGYDFARAITGDSSNISMLIKPGADIHAFAPTPEDIASIQQSDLFIYVGGESDKWITDLLNSNDISPDKTLRLMDLVEPKLEELPEGADSSAYNSSDSSPEYDEHIWTSPVNAIALVRGIESKLSAIHPDQKSTYAANADAYVSRLSSIDQSIRDIVASSRIHELIFGDRFPFRYFVDEYGLSYYAAFPGCSEQTEASSKTIAFLIDKAKSDNIRTILKTELTSDKLARAIADEVGATVLTLHAAHNISESDFTSGLTYASILENNLKVLQEALN